MTALEGHAFMVIFRSHVEPVPGLQALGHRRLLSSACLTSFDPMKTTRRTFLMTVAAGSAALSSTASGQAGLSEKDPQAIALGYFEEATKTDTKKWPKYAAGQLCNNCALY
jgi:hypothetical protein